MENELTVEFIEDYRAHECLWNIHSKYYTNKIKRKDAYSDLSRKYNLTEKGVKNKIKSLRSYFSKEHQKVTSKRSGASTESSYKSTWFAYRPLLFIADSVTPRQTKDSLSVDSSDKIPLDDTTGLSEDGNEIEEDDDDHSANALPSPGQHSASSLEKNINHVTGVQSVVPEAIRTKRNILKRKKSDDDEKEAEALNFLRTAAASIAEKDDCTVFGHMIGTEIRKLNPRNKVIAKNKIQNIIFQLQLDEMDGRTSAGTSVSASLSYNNSHQQSPSVLSVDGRVDSENVEMEEFLMFNLNNSEITKVNNN